MKTSRENDLYLRSKVIAPTMIVSVINLNFLAVLAALAALPAVALEFSVTATDLQWVLNGCALALAACLGVGSKRPDFLATTIRPLMSAAFFGLASLIGGAPDCPTE